MARACSRRGSASNRSRLAFAAAQASGFAMKVGPCISAAPGSSDRKAPNTSPLATVAASAMVPPVSAFDRHRMSGTMPACSQANRVPVRPNPVKISSAMSGSPCRRASAATVASTSGGCIRIPPAPWTSGSTMMAARVSRCSVSVRSRAAVSAAERGRSQKIWLGRKALSARCMPSAGSQTDIAPIVSPW